MDARPVRENLDRSGFRVSTSVGDDFRGVQSNVDDVIHALGLSDLAQALQGFSPSKLKHAIKAVDATANELLQTRSKELPPRRADAHVGRQQAPWVMVSPCRG